MELFRDKLLAAGVEVSHKRFENALHGFTHTKGPSAREAWQLMADFYKQYLPQLEQQA
jgi:acetyl esterase/lipase